MGAKKRLSHDQKRKAKLAKRVDRLPGYTSLAYAGRKFRTDELVPVFFRTEMGIYEAWVMTKRQFTDRDVASALAKLIAELREGRQPALIGDDHAEPTAGAKDDLIVWNIRRNWQIMFEEEPHPGTPSLIGLLRTLMHSLTVWGSPSASSQGYLSYLERFLKGAGASVRLVDPKTARALASPQPIPIEMMDPEPPAEDA